MTIDPRDLEGDALKFELDQVVGDLSADDLAAFNAAPPPSEPQADEKGRLRGQILSVRDDDVIVDIGGKSEGFISASEFDTPPEVGQVHLFMLQGRDPESGMTRLSLKAARTDAKLDTIKVGDIIEGRVTGTNIGGLELQVGGGLRAFLPKSQVELERIEDFAPYVNQKIECEVTEVDRKGKNLVVSRRKILLREREAARAALRDELAEGQLRQGIVRRLAEFGAFVDIGGVDGLLHVSDMSWGRVNKPGDVVKVGQEVEVKVLKIDRERDRISLGMKQLSPDPWNIAEGNYRVGETVEGRVIKLMDFGAFVELEPGIEGLIPVSEMSWTQRVRHPKDVLNDGDMVRVSVLAFDPNKRKITLSLRAMGADPWKDVAERFPVDGVVKGRVARLETYGAFIDIGDGVEGLAHISELSNERVRSVGDVLEVGQIVDVRIKSVDPEQRRVSLSLKMKAAEASAEDLSAHAASSGAAAKKRKKPLKGGLQW